MTATLTDLEAFGADEPTVRILPPAALSRHSLPLLLIADRESLVAPVVRRLTDLHWRVTVSRTVEEASRRVVEQDFAGILMDVRMEQDAGLPLLRARNEHNSDLSVVLICSGDDTTALPCAPVSETDTTGSAANGVGRLVSLLDLALTRSQHRRLIRRATHLLGTNTGPQGDLDDLVTPPAIRVLQRLGDLLARQTPTAEAIEQTVARCPAVAEGVLRLANRVRRASGDRYETLLEAINWQGIVRISQMTELLAARHLFEVHHAGIAKDIDAIWRYSLARAEAMRLLAERPELPPRCWFGDLYAAGLFADAGAAFILWLCDQGDWQTSGASASASSGSPATYQLIADQHEWMGEELVRRWRMGHEAARLAGNHHPRPNRLRLPFWPLGLAASDLADEVVDSPERAALRSPSAGAALDALELDARARRDLVGAVRENVDRLVEAIEDVSQSGLSGRIGLDASTTVSTSRRNV